MGSVIYLFIVNAILYTIYSLLFSESVKKAVTKRLDCHTDVSRVVEGPGGTNRYCVPLWPDVFGGPDGGDIVVCGGAIHDKITDRVYISRLPAIGEFPVPTTDPRIESMDGERREYRWRCATEGSAVDHMGNAYVPSPFDRLRMIRNYCAKFIYRSVALIGFTAGPDRGCDCLTSHGKVHVHADRWMFSRVTGKEMSSSVKVRPPYPLSDGIASYPYACSPCVAGGGLDAGLYVVSAARGCVKSYERPEIGGLDADVSEEFGSALDRFPCGVTGFDGRTVSCSTATAYVGIGLSDFGRRVIGLAKL